MGNYFQVAERKVLDIKRKSCENFFGQSQSEENLP